MKSKDCIEQRKAAEQKLENLRTWRYSWWVTWGEIAQYMLPRRYKWFIVNNQMNKGSYINQRIIDTTVVKCVRDLAAGLMSGVVNQSTNWFGLGLLDTRVMEVAEVKIWLADCRDRMMQVMAESNFYQACHVAFTDLCVFGTSPVLIYEDFDNVIHCYNPCAGEYFVGANYKFEVDTFAREFTLTAPEVVGMFGKENVSPNILNLIASNQIQTEITVCHLIEPNPDYIPASGRKLAKGFQFRETYWESGQSEEFCLRRRGFTEQPVCCPRWDLVSNDAYGRGPGMDALGDVKQLMKQQMRKAQGIEKMVNPPMMASVSMKNQPASTIAGGITYVNAADLSQGFKPVYEVNPQLEEMVADISEVQQRIKELFYNDLFLMISQLEGDGRTATEINERKQEKLIMLGPVVERLQKELMAPAINRIFNIIRRAGLFLPAPKIAEGHEVVPTYQSMFTEAQRAVSTAGFEQLMTMVGNLAAADQAVLDNIDFDFGVREYGDLLSVNPKIFKNPAVVAAIRQARQQQAQAAQNAQMAQAAVQGAQTLSQTDVGGGQNALAMMMGNQPGGGSGQPPTGGAVH